MFLDSDEEAQNNKERYRDIFGKIVENRIYTLSDVDSKWNKSLEALLTNEQKLCIQKVLFQNKKYTKNLYNKAIQELLMTKNKVEIDEKVINQFIRIHDFIKRKLQ